jgi:archaellum component FlaC
MKDELQQLTKIVHDGFEEMRAQFAQMNLRFAQVDARFAQVDARFEQIDARFEQIDARFEQVDARFEQGDDRSDGLKNEIQRVFAVVSSEQKLNDQRYYELKASIEDISSKMATKEQLDQVYESLSADITCMSGDSQKLTRRVDHLEKRVKRLEDR